MQGGCVAGGWDVRCQSKNTGCWARVRLERKQLAIRPSRCRLVSARGMVRAGESCLASEFVTPKVKCTQGNTIQKIECT